MSEQQTYFTKREAAEYIRSSVRFIDYLREQNELTAFKLANKRRLLFTREQLDQYVRKHAA
jgi:excisionase family DNA binding protein